jgi:F-type H+-transporting ATPase subunit gamma
MSASIASLRRQMASADDLQSVVRTMKALAAASVGQYERSVDALAEYYRIVELGLALCFRERKLSIPGGRRNARAGPIEIGAIVFGSDQGLVGQFNDIVTDHTIETLTALGGKHQVWAVGERAYERLARAGVPMAGLFAVPNSVEAIASLVGQIQIASEAYRTRGNYSEVYVFYNRTLGGALYAPVHLRLLPLDSKWQDGVTKVRWPTGALPEVIGRDFSTLRALIREYLFISLFRACAESLASENASRLAAMERADKNITDLLAHLNETFHRLRQSGIDEELFDVIAGFEALIGVQ